MSQLEENLNLMQLFLRIFTYVGFLSFFFVQSSLTHNTTNYPDPQLHLHCLKPRLFVTMVIGRLNSLQYSPDPQPIGSLQTLRRNKRNQHSCLRPTRVSPWPPRTLYFKCTITWTCNHTHTHTHTD